MVVVVVVVSVRVVVVVVDVVDWRVVVFERLHVGQAAIHIKVANTRDRPILASLMTQGVVGDCCC